MDYLDGGELFFHLRQKGKFDEETTCFYAAQIVLAVAHLHSKNIMYRDLKPENILLDKEGNALITDFGLAKLGMTKDKKTKSMCGTPEYLAPEIIIGKGYDKSADWWSLGIMIYEMLSGKHPYRTKNGDKMAMYQKIIDKPVKMRPEFSREAKSLINGLLAVKTHNRLGCSDLGFEEIKYHEFFRAIDWDKLEKGLIEPPFSQNELGTSAMYAHVSKDAGSVDDLMNEISDSESESDNTSPKLETKRKSRSNTKRAKEYRYFENFEFARNDMTKTK